MVLSKLKFQEVLDRLLQKNKLLEEFYDPKYIEVSIEFSMENFDNLVISRSGNIITAGHYYISKGHKIPDPMEVFVLQKGNIWFPHLSKLAITQFLISTYKESKDTEYPKIIGVNKAMLLDVTEFTEMFASNIEYQGWFKVEPISIIRREAAELLVGGR